MSTGRTIWWGKDCAWWEREVIVELGEEFGPAGPAVIDWLSCRAKMQNDGGMVKSGYRAIARGCFIDAVTVCHIVSRAVTLGALDDFEESDRTFTCRISGWTSDQGKADAAARQAKSRAKREASHGLSRPVTDGHKKSRTEEKRTEVEPPLTPPGGNAAAVALFPGGTDSHRQRDKAAAATAQHAWAAEHFTEADPRAVVACAAFALGHGWDPASGAEGLRSWAEQAGGQWAALLDQREVAA